MKMAEQQQKIPQVGLSNREESHPPKGGCFTDSGGNNDLHKTKQGGASAPMADSSKRKANKKSPASGHTRTEQETKRTRTLKDLLTSTFTKHREDAGSERSAQPTSTETPTDANHLEEPITEAPTIGVEATPAGLRLPENPEKEPEVTAPPPPTTTTGTTTDKQQRAN